MSSIKNPTKKKAQGLKKDHRVFTLEGNKTFRGKWRKKKRRLAKKERSAAQRLLSARTAGDSESPQRQISRKLRKTGVVTLGRALDIRGQEPETRFSLFRYSSRDHEKT